MIGVAALARVSLRLEQPPMKAHAFRDPPRKLCVAVEAQLRRQALLLLMTLGALLHSLQRGVRPCERPWGEELRADRGLTCEEDQGSADREDSCSTRTPRHDQSHRKPTRRLTQTCIAISASSTMARTTWSDRHTDMKRLKWR